MPTESALGSDDADAERFRRIDALFDAALDLPEDERDAFVDQVCAMDPVLRDELHRLLEAHRRSGDFLDAPAVELARPLLVDVELIGTRSPAAPERVGPFRIEREIGHGGMGVVYLGARDDGHFEQRVALKLMRRRGKAVTQRFVEERRILAMLEHPGIARLVDGGVTSDGLPYFAMEFVEGESIDQYCDARKLSIEARLRFFIALCNAVQYAHQQLIVHRDLKPSNVLIARDGQLKLLDFGIAKLVDADNGTDHALSAADGRAFSFPFAAPEQIRGEAVTTGTDVYASGVLLYRLLTGRLPFVFKGRTTADIEHMICTVEPPVPSSTVAGLRGDLDSIVLKAMHKNPAQRYQSAAALAEDVERFLAGHAVVARNGGAAYRARKFIRRHRAGVVVAALLAVASPVVALRERSLRAQSDSDARRAAAVEQYLVSVFDVADPLIAATRRGTDVTVRELLDRGVARIDSELVGAPDVQVEMQRVLGHVYLNLELHDKGEPLLRQVLLQQRARYGSRHPMVADAMLQLGRALMRLNRFDEADTLLRESLAQHRAFRGMRDSMTAASTERLAELMLQRSKYPAAESLYREALGIRRAIRGVDHRSEASILTNLAVTLTVRGNYAGAEPLLREALAIHLREQGPDNLTTAAAQLGLAQALQQRGTYAEAETLYRKSQATARRVLGDRQPGVAVSLHNLGNMLARQMGRPEEAEPMVREALSIDRAFYGERHNLVAGGLDNLGAVLRAKGDLDGAEAAFQQSMDMSRSINGAEHRITARAYANLAGVRHIRGDSVGVVPMLREARAQLESQLGGHASSVTTATLYLAQHVRERGHPAEADSIFRGLLTWLDTAVAPQRTQFYTAQLGLGQSLVDERRVAEAVPLLEGALAARLAEFGTEDWRTAEARMALGSSYIARGDRLRAEPLVNAASEVLQRQRRVQPRLARQAEAMQRSVKRGGESFLIPKARPPTVRRSTELSLP